MRPLALQIIGCGIYPTELSSWLQQIAADDFDGVKQTPWLTNIQDVAFRDDDAVDEIVNTWQHSGIKLLGSHLRIIPAQQFNKAIANGMNKADLLSESTLSLVRQAIEKQKDESSVKHKCFAIATAAGAITLVFCSTVWKMPMRR